MNKIKALVVAGVLAGASASVFASAWHLTLAGNSETVFFFDAESVERSRDVVTLWVKSVQTNQADKGGAWATASRWRIDCTKKTLQALISSDYTQSGKFIKSYPNPGVASDIIPDSVGDGFLKMVCKADFPKNIARKEYFKLDDNDVFRATRSYVEFQNSQIDAAPQ